MKVILAGGVEHGVKCFGILRFRYKFFDFMYLIGHVNDITEFSLRCYKFFKTKKHFLFLGLLEASILCEVKRETFEINLGRYEKF